MYSALVLWLLSSAKGKHVLSPDYQMAVALTPSYANVRSRVTILVTVIVGVALVVAGFVAFSR